jgi:hypothetical protein
VRTLIAAIRDAVCHTVSLPPSPPPSRTPPGHSDLWVRPLLPARVMPVSNVPRPMSWEGSTYVPSMSHSSPKTQFSADNLPLIMPHSKSA